MGFPQLPAVSKQAFAADGEIPNDQIPMTNETKLLHCPSIGHLTSVILSLSQARTAARQHFRTAARC